MAAIKPISVTADKWQRSTVGREKDYEDGIRNPRTPWAAATIAAADSYATAVTRAATEGRFARGVANVGDTKWQNKTLAVGARRWTEGISVSKGDYLRGFQPYHDVISALSLTPRVERGNPANLIRVAEVANALHAKKLELTAGR